MADYTQYPMQPQQPNSMQFQPQYNPNLMPNNTPWQYQRMAELEQRQQQMFPQYQPQQQMQPQIQTGQPMAAQSIPIPKTVIVPSSQEITQQNILDGSRYIFIDTSDPNKIYSRQMDFSTGKAPIMTYECTTPTETATGQPQAVSEVQEFKTQLSALEAKYEALEGRVNNGFVQHSTSDDAAEPTSKSDVPAVNADARTGNGTKPDSKSTNSKPAK